jgi:hypothetical protein
MILFAESMSSGLTDDVNFCHYYAAMEYFLKNCVKDLLSEECNSVFLKL